MPPELDVTTDSSTVTDVTPDPSTGADATAQAVVEDVNTETAPSLLDVVRDAVEPKTDAAPAEVSSTAEVEKAELKPEGEAAQAEEPENFDNEPFGRHPRFQQVLKSRNDFKTQAEGLTAEVEALKGPAESYSKITTFLEETGVTDEEMVNLFRVAALVKSDPEKALEALNPTLAELYERTGRFLPNDLKEDIEAGRITEERGRELARERAARRESDSRAERAEERATRVETTTAADRQSEVFTSTLADWQATTKVKDPDFDAKETLIADRCRTIIAEKGQPKSAADMRTILDQAHTDVSAHLRKFVPAREEVKPGPKSTSSPVATAVPKTLLEAITIAAAQGR